MYIPQGFDALTLDYIRRTMPADQLKKAEEAGALVKSRRQDNLHPEKVLVHGKYGDYYAYRNKKNADDRGAKSEYQPNEQGRLRPDLRKRLKDFDRHSRDAGKTDVLSDANRRFLKESDEAQNAFIAEINRQDEVLRQRRTPPSIIAVRGVEAAVPKLMELRDLDRFRKTFGGLLSDPAYGPMQKYHAIVQTIRKQGGKPLSKEELLYMQHALGLRPDQVVDAPRIKGEHTWRQDLTATNPWYKLSPSEVFRRNCQYCVCAYEARRRGYDVMARPIKMRGDEPEFEARFNSVFDSGILEDVIHEGARERIDEVRSKMRSWGEGSRAILSGKWNGEDQEPHVFFAEVINGKVHFVDPQNDKQDAKNYFRRMSMNSMRIMRVDNLDFNLSINEMVEPRGRNK